MKKEIFIIIASALTLFFLGINQAHAQTATATVNLILADVLSIEFAVTPNAIDFKYNTAEDYNNSKIVTISESLVISSSTNFEVKVKANGANFNYGTHRIPVSVLKIRALPGGTLQGIFNTITLSTLDQKLISSLSKGLYKTVNLEYSIAAEKATSVLLGKSAGSYTQTVTYTATEI